MKPLKKNNLRDEAGTPTEDDGWVVFGPLVRQVAAESSSLVRERLPLVHQALGYVAHPAIRTRGTIVGSIAHADPAAEMPAVLAALGGEVRVRGASGTHTVVGDAFFTGPLDNSLAPNEWVEEVRFPAAAPGQGFAFEEFARRSGDYALCGVAAVVSSDEARLTYLGVGVTPRTVVVSPDETDLEDVVATELSPYDDIHSTADYKRFLAVNLGRKALRRALEAAG